MSDILRKGDNVSEDQNSLLRLPTPSHSRYTNLLSDIEKGEIKIPQFQRDFVWSVQKSAALLDSVIKGYLSERSFFYYSTANLIGGLKKLTFIPNLRGTKVSVAGIGRSDHADRRPLTLKEMAKLTDFWKAYFKEASAGDTYIGQSLPTQ